jgi:uncharacterized protein (DUF983 family)
MTAPHGNETHPALPLALARGLALRCPNCGQGKLFHGYLKGVDRCAVCGENYSGIESGDAAPWFSMLIVGILAAPLYFIFGGVLGSNLVLTTVFYVAAITILVLLVLPPVKGVLISAFWHSRGTRGAKH